MWVRENGRQLYLGGFNSEEWAAEAFDIVAIKRKGAGYPGLNFDPSRYHKLLPLINDLSLDKLIESVRARQLRSDTFNAATAKRIREVAEAEGGGDDIWGRNDE